MGSLGLNLIRRCFFSVTFFSNNLFVLNFAKINRISGIQWFTSIFSIIYIQVCRVYWVYRICWGVNFTIQGYIPGSIISPTCRSFLFQLYSLWYSNIVSIILPSIALILLTVFNMRKYRQTVRTQKVSFHQSMGVVPSTTIRRQGNMRGEKGLTNEIQFFLRLTF